MKREQHVPDTPGSFGTNSMNMLDGNDDGHLERVHSDKHRAGASSPLQTHS